MDEEALVAEEQQAPAARAAVLAGHHEQAELGQRLRHARVIGVKGHRLLGNLAARAGAPSVRRGGARPACPARR